MTKWNSTYHTVLTAPQVVSCNRSFAAAGLGVWNGLLLYSKLPLKSQKQISALFQHYEYK